MLRKQPFALFTLLLTAPTVLATNNTSVQELSTTPNRYSITASTTMETSLREGSEYRLVNTTSMTNAYVLASGYRFSNTLTVDKDLQNDRKSSLRDSAVYVSKGLPAMGDIRGSWKAAIGIPLSKRSHKDTSYLTALTAGVTLSYNASKYVPGLRLYYLPDVKMSFYEYKTGKHSGTSNNQYRVLHRLMFDYYINPKISLSLDNIYYKNWTFEGTTTDFYALNQSASYYFHKNYSVSIGHSIGGNALDIDGRSSGVTIFDTDDSTIYSTLVFRY